jgi:hypothetical protein
MGATILAIAAAARCRSDTIRRVPKAAKKSTYRIIFQQQGQVVELYAHHVGQGALFGFVEVEDLIFGARSQVVVDPGEESLRNEFGGAKRVYVPLHSVVRIDEVEREGASRIRSSDLESAVVRAFPMPVLPPGGPRSK